MNNRRRFITLVPFAGAAFLAACSKESTTTANAPAASPTPAPAPAPVVPEPAVTASAAVSNANLPMLDESDAIAVSLGYVAVSSRVDGNKYKNHLPAQACNNCALFAGNAGEAQGPCPLFAGKQVAAAGWCSAYVKKAG